MPIPTAKLAQRRAKLRTKLDGTNVTLHWTEWPGGSPPTDPTTGAKLVTTQDPPEAKTATVRAFVHFTGPATSGYRKFSEVEQGDAIVDFPLDILRITDAGDTSLEVDDVVDEIAFSQANLAVADGEDTATASDIELSELENLSFEFAGKRWVQKEIGEGLARCWDSIYADLNINRAILLRQA